MKTRLKSITINDLSIARYEKTLAALFERAFIEPVKASKGSKDSPSDEAVESRTQSMLAAHQSFCQSHQMLREMNALTRLLDVHNPWELSRKQKEGLAGVYEMHRQMDVLTALAFAPLSIQCDNTLEGRTEARRLLREYLEDKGRPHSHLRESVA